VQLSDRFGKLVGQYDNSFKLLRQAAYAEVPCDWGIDLSEGPQALLPGLARAKAMTQAARLRTLWALQNGRQDLARDDLLTVFALGRNTSRDGLLISALVQIAIENITFSIVAENFGRFSPETLAELAAEFDAAPERGTIAQCVFAEKAGFHDWLLRKIETLQRQYPGDDARVVAQIRELLTSLGGDESGPDVELADRVIKAAGGTSDGVIRLARELEPLYQRVAEILALPYSEYTPQMKAFNAEIQAHSNPLVKTFFSALDKCRQREFASIVRLAMVQAAVNYRQRGEQGLQSIADPCGNGPFEFRRFTFNGVDRGFELKSAYKGRGYSEVMIFVEKDGPPFRIDGPNPGEALPQPVGR
jgi:hypothetical protein